MCTNVDGFEHLASLMVRKAERLRCYGGAIPGEEGIDYEVSAKPWMTTPIFFQWLQRFDACIGCTQGRKALLSLDYCSTHSVITIPPHLLSVQEEFLPKSITPILQSIDLGVRACLKNRYKHLLAQRAVDLLETGISDNLYKTDLRTAAMWVYNVWSRILNDII